MQGYAAATNCSLSRAHPFVPRRGLGCVVEDVDGNLFLDFSAGLAGISTGHAHPSIVEAVHRQSLALLGYSACACYPPICYEMCAALVATAPFSGEARVLLADSGAEAVEEAMKLVRAVTGRQWVLSFWGAHHGRSYGALSLTASDSAHHLRVGPLLPAIAHAPYGYCHRCPLNLQFPDCALATADWLERVLFEHEVSPAEVAAVFVEPIQGAGGYIVPPPGWLERVAEICRRYGILLVADEVQSGVGRSGRMWAMEHSGVEPDVVVSGNGLASGMPLGALIARADLLERWNAEGHDSTLGGNPVACAAGLATLQLIGREGLLRNAEERGATLRRGMTDIAYQWPEIVTDVRGVGLMLGMEFASPEVARAVVQAAFRRGLLALMAGNSTVGLTPALVITGAECISALGLLRQAVTAVANEPPEVT
jgi:4-aminobutyrate aminotransferase